jgi:uncharacterized repeat protein (TIGR03803 family)
MISPLWSGVRLFLTRRAGFIVRGGFKRNGFLWGLGLIACVVVIFFSFLQTPAQTQTTVKLTTFTLTGDNGGNLYAGLIQGSDGNFYGTASSGGGGLTSNADCYGNTFYFGCGTVFRMTPSGDFSTLHDFNITDGASPTCSDPQS